MVRDSDGNDGFLPFDQAPLWKLHDAYFQQRGLEAWSEGEIPYLSTNNYAVARMHADVLVQAVQGLSESGALEPAEEVFILEAGAGSGKFAANILRAMDTEFGEAGWTLAKRLRYVYSDYSETTVRQACESPDLKDYVENGRVIPALYDLRNPSEINSLEHRPLHLTFAAVFANYIACVLPTKHLRKEGGVWSELMVRVQGAGDGDAGEPLDEEQLEHFLEEATRPNLLQELKTEYRWDLIDLSELFDNGIHSRVPRQLLSDLEVGTFGYPYGFLDCLCAMAKFLLPGSIVVVNDYGTVDRSRLSGRRQQLPTLYGNSMSHQIDFCVFDAFVSETDFELIRSKDPLRAVHTAVFSPAPGHSERTKEALERVFLARHDGQDLLDFSAAARSFRKQKNWPRAARFFCRCVGLDPYNPEFYYLAGTSCLAANQYQTGVDYLLKGLDVDKGRTQDFEFQLGRGFSMLGDSKASIDWYMKSVAREDHHVTRANLGTEYEALHDYKNAYLCYRKSLELKPDYERARDRLEALKNKWWEETVGGLEMGGNES